MYIWLDLKLIRYFISAISICIGLFICTNNYKSMSIRIKRNIQSLVNLVFCTYALCIPVYLISNFEYKYNLLLGFLMMLAGITLGIIYQIFNTYLSEYLFTITIGISTGFWIANTLEICYLYTFNNFGGLETYYFSYPFSVFLCFILAWQFHYNLYNYMLTFSGSCFIVWGLEMSISVN